MNKPDKVEDKMQEIWDSAGDDLHSTHLTVDDYEWIPEVFRWQLEDIGFV